MKRFLSIIFFCLVTSFFGASLLKSTDYNLDTDNYKMQPIYSKGDPLKYQPSSNVRQASTHKKAVKAKRKYTAYQKKHLRKYLTPINTSPKLYSELKKIKSKKYVIFNKVGIITKDRPNDILTVAYRAPLGKKGIQLFRPDNRAQTFKVASNSTVTNAVPKQKYILSLNK